MNEIDLGKELEKVVTGLKDEFGYEFANVSGEVWKILIDKSKMEAYDLDVLKTILYFFSWPPLPRGVPGEGPECHFPKEIIGFGPIPARILKFRIFILALSSARMTGSTSCQEDKES